MLETIPLLRGRVTLSTVLSEDDNMAVQIRYPQQREEFLNYLSTFKAEIEALVLFHLRLKNCRVGERGSWISGSYNVCIPVYISPPSDACVLVRIPLPYKIGEANFPGNVDEKLRCEAASYIWMQENCPNVKIPVLFGFGFPDGQTFTAPENVPFLTRLMWRVRRKLLSWLRVPVPCRFVGRRRLDVLKTGYIIIMSFVRDGNLLSNSWEKLHHDKTRRATLFRGLAQIILSLNKSPLSSIGSLTMDNQGLLTLTNRPLTLRLQSLENEGIPSTIYRRSTYSAVDTYLLDLLGCHDNRIQYQPNSMHDIDDGQRQLAALTMMRAVLHHFIRREYRHGPFVFTLTDLHQSNIFVDDEWHITCLIDLEWACSLPIEMQCPPYWLSGRAVDDIEHGEPLETYGQAVEEFFDAFAREEKNIVGETLYQTPIMRRCWESGAFWYFQAVNSPKGLYRIFNHHIQRLYCPEHCRKRLFDQVVAPYWSFDVERVIEKKIKDEEEYKDQLREVFAAEVDSGLSTE